MADIARIEELRRRLRKDPASIAFAQLAEEHRRAGEYEEAIRVCRVGLAQHPRYISARLTLARALIELGAVDEAAAEIDHVLQVAPENLAAERVRQDLQLRRYHLQSGATAMAVATIDAGRPAAGGAVDPPDEPSHRADPVLLQLESWLAAILADRDRRHAAR